MKIREELMVLCKTGNMKLLDTDDLFLITLYCDKLDIQRTLPYLILVKIYQGAGHDPENGYGPYEDKDFPDKSVHCYSL